MSAKLIFFLFLNIVFGSEIQQKAENEFYIAYKAKTTNQILKSEHYYITKALSKSHDYTLVGECEFIDASNLDDKNLEKILNSNKDGLLSCLQQNLGVNINDEVQFINNAIHAKTKMEYAPQRFIAAYNDGKIRIKFIEKLK